MKTDLRVVKTKAAIESAFTDLVEEKGYDNVRLVDIAKKANVNRNTIYLHYSSKEGIIEAILFDTFNEELEKLNVSQFVNMRISKRSVHNMFQMIFNQVEEKIELYRIVLTDENLVGYVDILINTIKKTIKQAVKETIQNDLTINYMVFGAYGLIRDWIVYAKGTKEENIEAATNLVVLTLRHLQVR